MDVISLVGVVAALFIVISLSEPLGAALNPREEREEIGLAGRGTGRSPFVDQEGALTGAALLEDPKEALAVRMREVIRAGARKIVEIPRDAPEGLGPEEPARCTLGQPPPRR